MMCACGNSEKKAEDDKEIVVALDVDDLVKEADKAITVEKLSLNADSWETSSEFDENSNTYTVIVKSKPSQDDIVKFVFSETEATQICKLPYNTVSDIFKDTGVTVLVKIKDSKDTELFEYDGEEIVSK